MFLHNWREYKNHWSFASLTTKLYRTTITITALWHKRSIMSKAWIHLLCCCWHTHTLFGLLWGVFVPPASAGRWETHRWKQLLHLSIQPNSQSASLEPRQPAGGRHTARQAPFRRLSVRLFSLSAAQSTVLIPAAVFVTQNGPNNPKQEQLQTLSHAHLTIPWIWSAVIQTR